MRRRIPWILLAWLLAASPGAGEPEGLLQRAERLALADDPTWHALLHVVPGPLGLGRSSEIPAGTFFLAADGRSNPRAELEATLRALLAGGGEGDDAVHCRFPARTQWLRERLGATPEELGAAPCPALDAWRVGLAPRGITMILPEAFMNNPASMFGHTLLRLDVADPSAPQNLLAFAIDFTANTGGDAGPVFLLRGATGRYQGLFGLNPYYEKLEVYADWQNRDIWEYPLDLAPAEVDFVLLHLWELDDVPIPYFFFRENCSYQLIRLLAVVRPGIRFGHGFPVGVIPIDTVRDALDAIGLAGDVGYRPSPATELRAALHALPEASRALALALAADEVAPDDPRVEALAPADRGAVLGAAYEAVRYELVAETLEPEEARRRSYPLLVARSRAPGGAPEVPRPRVRPDEGHGTALVELGAGVEDNEGFLELRVRPALHGALQPVAGFPGDSTIRFLDTKLRFYPRTNRVRLEELVLFDLQSNTARDAFFEPLSWGMGTGLATRLFPGNDGDLERDPVWRTAGNLGLTWQVGPLRVYGLADARLEVGGDFDGGWALGPGFELGAELEVPGDRYEARLFARGTRFLAGDRDTDLEIGLGQRLTLTRTTAAVAELGGHHYDGESWWDARLSLQWTF